MTDPNSHRPALEREQRILTDLKRDHATVLMSTILSILDDHREHLDRWFADEYGVTRATFLREAGPHIIVMMMGEERAVEPRDLYANPYDAQIGHEMLRSNAEARLSEGER